MARWILNLVLDAAFNYFRCNWQRDGDRETESQFRSLANFSFTPELPESSSMLAWTLRGGNCFAKLRFQLGSRSRLPPSLLCQRRVSLKLLLLHFLYKLYHIPVAKCME